MADPFVAEIRLLPFNFAPKGWAHCDGQFIPLSQNTALFSLLRTTYGGNGSSYFGLPNLQGRAPMHPGQGPGLSLRNLGEVTGSETVTLLESQMPAHRHGVEMSVRPADTLNPGGSGFGSGNAMYVSPPANLLAMSPQVVTTAGGDLPHNNLMPYLTVYFNIALQGVFPPRS